MAFTVKATPGGASFSRGVDILVRVYTNATESGGASSGSRNTAAGAAQGTLTPNFSSSAVVFAIASDGATTNAAAAASNTYDANGPAHTDTWIGASGHYTGTVTSGTALTYGAGSTASGADHENWCAYEIPASGGTITLDGSSPAGVSSDTGATATSGSFTPPVGSVIVVTVIAGGTGAGAGVTCVISDTSGLGLTWTQRVTSSTSDNFQPTFIFTTTVPSSFGPVVPLLRPPWERPWQPALAKQFGPGMPFSQQPVVVPFVPPPPPPAGQQAHGYGSSRRSIGAVFGGIANSPLPSPAGQAPGGVVVPRRATQRARLLAAHIAGTVSAAVTGAAGSKPGGFLARRRPARAVFAGLAVAPILAHAAVGGMVAQRPAEQRPRAVTAHVTARAFPNGSKPGGTGVYRRAPARAVTGHIAGIAHVNGSKPGGTSVYRRAPARAVTAHITGRALGIAGSGPGGTVGRRGVARAVTAHITGRAAGVLGPAGSKPGGSVTRRGPARAVTAHGYGSAPAPGVVAGSPPGGLVVRRQPGGVLWGGLASSRVAPAALGPAGSKPGGLVARRSPARAVTAHVTGPPSATVPLGPAGNQPGGLVVRRQSGGVLWGGLASSRVAATVPAGSRPGGVVARRAPARGSWHGLAVAPLRPGPLLTIRPQVGRRQPVIALWGGPAPGVAVVIPAGSKPGGAVARRSPARAVTAHVTGQVRTIPVPAGSQPGGIAARRSPVQRPRAVTAHAASAAHLNGSQPGGLVRRRAPARAFTAGTVVRTVNAGPTPPVRGTLQPVAAQPAQRPASRRSRAVAAHIASTARINGSQPGGIVRRRSAYRAVWAAVTGTIAGKPAVGGLTAQRSPAQRPRAVSTGHAYGTVRRPVPATGGLTAQRAPQQRPRLVTGHTYGPPVFPPGSIQPHPSVNRRRPARAQWLGTVVRTVNAPPVVASPGTVAARDWPAQTVEATDWPAQTVAAADRAAFTVAAEDMSP